MVRIIDYSENNGGYNMRFDERLLDEALETNSKEPVLRFYGWTPACVSLGRNQSEKNINIEYCTTHKIDIVRRPTGGRGLFHDKEITYSFICSVDILKNGSSITGSYKEICNAIIKGFKELDIELAAGEKKQGALGHDYCMLLATGADLCFKGKKLAGSAQYRKHGFILQHGSILMDYDMPLIKTIFNEPSFKEELTCIREINSLLTREKIIDSLKKSFTEIFGSICG